MTKGERERVRDFCSLILARADLDEIEGVLDRVPDRALRRLRDAILEAPVRAHEPIRPPVRPRPLPGKDARRAQLVAFVERREREIPIGT